MTIWLLIWQMKALESISLAPFLHLLTVLACPLLRSYMENSVLNPVSNTGLNCLKVSPDTKISVGIDWLQFLLEFDNSIQVRNFVDYLGGLFNDPFIINWGCHVNHGRVWEHSGRSQHGSCIAFNDAKATLTGVARARLWVSLCSHTLQRGSDKILPFLRKMKLWQAEFTRIDVCIDDYGKRLPVQLPLEACEAGNAAGFEKYDPRFPRKIGQDKYEAGWTLYLGSPQSEKRVRYYNKSVESGGKIDSYRWETQFRGKYAQAIIHTIYSLDSSKDDVISAYLSSIALGAVDFVDKSSGDRRSRRDRLSWWSEFVNAVSGSARLALPKVVRSIQRTLDWISSQVETSLAMLYEYFDGVEFDAYLLERLNSGRARFKEVHYKILESSS